MEKNIITLSPGNTYGCLVIKAEGNKYYWGMEDATDMDNYQWEEISPELYTLLEKTK